MASKFLNEKIKRRVANNWSETNFKAKRGSASEKVFLRGYNT